MNKRMKMSSDNPDCEYLSQLKEESDSASEKIQKGFELFQNLIANAEKVIADKLASAEQKAQNIIKAAQDTRDEADQYRELEKEKIKDERASLEEEKRLWEGEKAIIAKTQHLDPQVKLDIGGHTFTTTLTTLTRIPDSMLGAMFSGRHTLEKNESGAYFIDRDGTHFRHILNFLRSPENFDKQLLNSSELLQLQREAAYYQLKDLMFPKPKRNYPINQSFPDDRGNQVKLSQSSGKWHLMDNKYAVRGYGVGSGYDTVVTVCTNCSRGFGTASGICLSLADFDDGTRDLKLQPKVERCQYCQ
jgi:BTB/POZ domain